jgi:hypothetical protein
MNPNTNSKTESDGPLVDGWFCTGGCGAMGFGNPINCPECGRQL